MTALHQQTGSPGSHPHADQANWRPATNIDDYIRNCQEGLEKRSDRRAAKLLGISRAEFWRWRLMGQLPDDLFEALLKAGHRPSTKSLAAVALAIKNDDPLGADSETCPHCGGTLLVRRHVSKENLKIVADWMMARAENGGAMSRRRDNSGHAAVSGEHVP